MANLKTNILPMPSKATMAKTKNQYPAYALTSDDGKTKNQYPAYALTSDDGKTNQYPAYALTSDDGKNRINILTML